MAAILDPDTELDGIRYAIDIDLSTDDLPHTIIQDSIYLGNAEAWVVRIDADAATRTGTELTHVKNSIKFYCAALIIPAIRQRIQNTTSLGEDSSLSIRYKEFDWEKRQQELFGKAHQEIQAIESVDDDERVPSFFEALAGGRGT